MSAIRLLCAVAAGLGGLVLWMYLAHVDAPGRPVVTLVFFATAPGLAIVSRLRLGDPLLEVALVFATSAAATMLVAQAMVWTGVWSPTAGVLVMLAAVAAATATPDGSRS